MWASPNQNQHQGLRPTLDVSNSQEVPSRCWSATVILGVQSVPWRIPFQSLSSRWELVRDPRPTGDTLAISVLTWLDWWQGTPESASTHHVYATHSPELWNSGFGWKRTETFSYLRGKHKRILKLVPGNWELLLKVVKLFSCEYTPINRCESYQLLMSLTRNFKGCEKILEASYLQL